MNDSTQGADDQGTWRFVASVKFPEGETVLETDRDGSVFVIKTNKATYIVNSDDGHTYITQ